MYIVKYSYIVNAILITNITNRDFSSYREALIETFRRLSKCLGHGFVLCIIEILTFKIDSITFFAIPDAATGSVNGHGCWSWWCVRRPNG